MIDREKLLAAARAADMAAAAETPQQEWRAVMEVLAHRETIQLGLMTSEMNGLSQNPHHEERLPIRDEGDDIGRIEARIPKKLFFHLMQQRNFGFDGFCDDGGMRDFLKTHPACAVKTVSGRTTVSVGRNFSTGRRRKALVNFGRGTLNLAN